jgi:hypothetical protein
MTINAKRAAHVTDRYSVSLQQAAAALCDENFWGREKINPEQNAVKGRARRCVLSQTLGADRKAILVWAAGAAICAAT